MARDVLQHDDGVIDQHAHTERQSAEGHDIQREPAEGHDDKGHHDRDGNGRADNKCAAHVAEKQVHHHHGQDSATYRRHAGVL